MGYTGSYWCCTGRGAYNALVGIGRQSRITGNRNWVQFVGSYYKVLGGYERGIPVGLHREWSRYPRICGGWVQRTTRWSTSLSSKVNLSQTINFWSRNNRESDPNEIFVLHRVGLLHSSGRVHVSDKIRPRTFMPHTFIAESSLN